MRADNPVQNHPVTLVAVPAETGNELGKYHLVAEIARGGMGIAYLAVLAGPDGFRKLVVVKELRPELLRTGACLKMFMDEARLAARLNHPNIVQTIEVGADGSRRFIAMEYLDGQPLQQLVQRALQHSTRMPLRMHLGILLDVLSALEYAHGLTDFDGTALGVVHRDVSPHNVIVTYEGQIKLVDFGISETTSAVEQSRAIALQGKMRYMSPEQAAGLRVDRRADLFAVGAMLWEAVVGHRPWEGQSDSAVFQSLMSGVVPRVRNAWPDVDPGLAAVIERAMQVEPSARYPTAASMRDDLERYIGTRNLAPPSGRSLGAWVSKLFAADRDERRLLIDTHLRVLDRGGSGAHPSQRRAKVATPVAAVSGVFAQPPPGDEGGVSGERPRKLSPRLHAHRRDLKKPAIVAVAAGIGVVFALGSFGAYRFRAVEVRGASAGAAAGAPISVAPPIDGLSGKAHAIVIASPASAQVYLDDMPVSNPYIADHPRDAMTHHLRIESPGYETTTRTFTFTDDIDLEIALNRASAGPGGRRAPVRPTPPPVALGCQPPYVVDVVTGKKHWKLECLESDPTQAATPANATPSAAPAPAKTQTKPGDTVKAYRPFSADQL